MVCGTKNEPRDKRMVDTRFALVPGPRAYDQKKGRRKYERLSIDRLLRKAVTEQPGQENRP